MISLQRALLLTSAGCLCMSVAGMAQDAGSPWKTEAHAIVYVIRRNSEGLLQSGTGFIISPNGYFLTAKHLLPQAAGEYLQAIIGSNMGTTLTITDQPLVSDHDDVALLHLPQLPDNTSSVSLCDSSQAQIGDQLVSVGFPEGGGMAPTWFRLKNTQGPDGLFVADANLDEGDSGGPVFNGAGKVIGLVEGGHPATNKNDIVVPINRASGELLNVSQSLIPGSCGGANTMSSAKNSNPAPAAPSPIHDGNKGWVYLGKVDAGQNVWESASHIDASSPRDLAGHDVKLTDYVNLRQDEGPPLPGAQRGWRAGQPSVGTLRVNQSLHILKTEISPATDGGFALWAYVAPNLGIQQITPANWIYLGKVSADGTQWVGQHQVAAGTPVGLAGNNYMLSSDVNVRQDRGPAPPGEGSIGWRANQPKVGTLHRNNLIHIRETEISPANDGNGNALWAQIEAVER